MKQLAWMLFCLSATTHATEITGTVFRVIDGDTLIMFTPERVPHTVRLTEIDAPERKQPYGVKASAALDALCTGKPVVVHSTKKDRFGRTLGRVFCNGKDANADMIAQGMAWVYTRYNTDKSLIPLQRAAKEEEKGLWSDPQPVPPWEWRKRK